MISRWDRDRKFAEMKRLIGDSAVENWEKLDKTADELLSMLLQNFNWFLNQIFTGMAVYHVARGEKTASNSN